MGAPRREVTGQVGVGLKPISFLGTERLVHSAISYAIQGKRKSVTLVHKGNIMKFTEGAFRDWGYQVAKESFAAVEVDGGPWCRIPQGKPGAGTLIKDAIADITLQQVLTRPEEFDVIATPNLNGDYLSDALAAQVGGIGIAPGRDIDHPSRHNGLRAAAGVAGPTLPSPLAMFPASASTSNGFRTMAATPRSSASYPRLALRTMTGGGRSSASSSRRCSSSSRPFITGIIRSRRSTLGV